MKRSLSLVAAVAAAFVAPSLFAAAADAKTLRWARTQDALTLDPHAQNEGPTATMLHQIYEPLVMRDHTGAMVPALATAWAPSDVDPNVWTFTLRRGVTFHDGAAFDADDVVFSLNRARHNDSNYKELLSSIVDVVKVDSHTVNVVTNGPNPILPSNLTNLFMMDAGWAAANGAEKPQNFAAGEDNYAARNVNGTGPYVLVSREADTRTVMRANPDYWGKGAFPLDVTEIVFTPIKNPATRVAALLSGEVDFIQDVPVQDLDRVASTPGLVLGTTPQNRTIFFGLDVSDNDLPSDDVQGRNPFADLRVRQAMNMAINRDAIRQVVMRGQSQPTGVVMPPFVAGWTEALDAYPPHDVAKARALIAEAGFPNGFTTRLDCPNDRYVNDEAICQAAVGMFGQIGIKVQLEARPRSLHFPLIANGETHFYLLGWGVPTYDSEYIFNFLVHTRTESFGSWNATRFSDPALDEKIRSLASNVNLEQRAQTVAEIWGAVKDATIYLPIHHQVLNWGFSAKVATLVEPEDSPKIKYFQMAD